MQGYYRLIHQLDDIVGSMVAQLKEKKLDRRTVIIFSSDNGYYMGEYGLADKWYGSQPSVRVPLIVYDPRTNAPHGIRSTALALNIDIAPTILDLAHLPIPSTIQGKSLTKLDQIEARKDFLYEHLWINNDIYIPSTEGVVNRNFKYMRYFKNADSTHLMFEELYDLKNDPHETNNLVNQPQQQRLRDSLKCRMWALKKEAR